MTETTPNPLRLIGIANRTFSRIVDAPLRELGFAIGQLPVLVALKQHEALPQAELARLAQVEQSSMAQLLNRMERDGLVERVPAPDDKRSRLISLSEDAARRMPKARAVMESTSRRALAGFSEKERDQLFALLTRVNENLDRIDAEANG